MGLEIKDAVQMNEDPLLSAWWDNRRKKASVMPSGELFSETILSVPIVSRRLVAKFDRFLVAEDGRVLIFDWKTGRRKPNRAEGRALRAIG